MPYAIVIHAFPRTDLPLAHAQGKILHGLFYELLQKASAAKGDEVHSVSGLKPFSTALLLNERQRRAECIRAGEEVKVRFTFLDDSLYPLLARYFLSTPDLSFDLVRTELTIVRILSTPQSGEEWAGCASFADIYASASDGEKLFSFQFATPTFFKRGGGPAYPDLIVPLPLPDLVFGSLLRNWNQFSPTSFIEANLLKEICLHHLEITHHRLSSQLARLVFPWDEGAYRTSTFPGFVGSCSFRLLELHDQSIIQTLNALADFAFFAGVGAKTTMGCGVAKRL
ncbi:MAG: CRISPR-associated endoribonuclease Cas6 [Candidatus Binatia bacterium]